MAAKEASTLMSKVTVVSNLCLLYTQFLTMIHNKFQFLKMYNCTANILTVLSTAFGSVTFPTVIWLCMLPPKTAIDLKLYSSMSLSVMGTAVGCDHYCQITVGNVTQPMTVNWL